LEEFSAAVVNLPNWGKVGPKRVEQIDICQVM